MKRMICIVFVCSFAKVLPAQDNKQKIERVCLDYIEGFYEGDTTKLIRSLKPSLYKFGYWKNKTSGVYEPDGNMTYHQAIDYAKAVYTKKNFAKESSPKKVEILDIMNCTAAAKVTAWWAWITFCFPCRMVNGKLSKCCGKDLWRNNKLFLVAIHIIS